MRGANGGVASTVCVISCSRTEAFSPWAPPKVVVRFSARIAWSPRACLSSRASCVPPRISTRMVDRLYAIGIGAGDPSWLTLEAVDALAALDVLFVLDKGDELTAARRALLARHAPRARGVTIEDPPRGRGAEAGPPRRGQRGGGGPGPLGA